METTLVSIDVDGTPVPHHPSARNSICINLVNQIQRLAIDESSETKTCTGRYPSPSYFAQINLDFHDYDFSPSYLFSLIDYHLLSPHTSDLITQKMAYCAIQHIGKPYRMFVDVVTTENVFVTGTCSHQKEEEEEEDEEEESTCAICLEDMLNDEKMKLVFPCSHRFHLRCIAEWLQTSNSCPLCRQILI